MGILGFEIAMGMAMVLYPLGPAPTWMAEERSGVVEVVDIESREGRRPDSRAEGVSEVRARSVDDDADADADDGAGPDDGRVSPDDDGAGPDGNERETLYSWDLSGSPRYGCSSTSLTERARSRTYNDRL